MKFVWTVDRKGTLTPVRVHEGITDGRNTVVQGATLSEGTTIVVGVTDAGSANDLPASRNPLQPQQGGEGG